MSTEQTEPKPVGRAKRKRKQYALPPGYSRYFVTMDKKLWKKLSVRGIEEERSVSEILDQAARIYLANIVPDTED